MTTGTIPTNPPADPPTDPPTPGLLKEVIPAEFHDRAYLKDWLDKPQGADSFAEVFKKLDNAQTLIGKKTGIPEGDDDTEWENFHAKLRPEKSDAYEIKTAEGETVDEEFAKTLRESFHAAGLSTRSAKILQDKMLGQITAKQAAAKVAQEQADAEFDTLAKAALGPDNAKVLERAKAALVEHAPDALKDHLGKLDDKGLVILAGVVDSMLKKYASEDDLNKGPGASDSAGTDLREEGRKLMASPEYRDQFHANHEAAKKRVVEIYATLAKK